MKKIGMYAILAMLIISTVSAIDMTGFNLDKSVVVKGDWEWVGSSWSKTNPVTAIYGFSVSSPLATISSIDNIDITGTPWKYAGQISVSVNKPAQYTNGLNALTINDPKSTPATGGYTKFAYSEITQIDDVGAASSINIGFGGYGNVDYSSVIQTDAESTQTTIVEINQ